MMIDVNEIFENIDEIYHKEYHERNKKRLALGKSKAKEWIQVESTDIKDIINAIKLHRPSYINKEIKTFPLNRFYFISDKGYVFRLHTWDKDLNREEVERGESSIRWQLSVIDKKPQQKIYISFKKIKEAKALGYKVFNYVDKNDNTHYYIAINSELLKQCCFENKMLQFEDKRENQHLEKSVVLCDSDGVLHSFNSQKECYDKMFCKIVSEKTFKRAIKSAKETGELMIKKQKYTFL